MHLTTTRLGDTTQTLTSAEEMLQKTNYGSVDEQNLGTPSFSSMRPCRERRCGSQRVAQLMRRVAQQHMRQTGGSGHETLAPDVTDLVYPDGAAKTSDYEECAEEEDGGEPET